MSAANTAFIDYYMAAYGQYNEFYRQINGLTTKYFNSSSLLVEVQTLEPTLYTMTVYQNQARAIAFNAAGFIAECLSGLIFDISSQACITA